MRNIASPLVWLALVCLVLVVACTGGEGTTCFQLDECNELLVCCHVGSPFTQGSCETEQACDELQGGGSGGTGGTAGSGGQGGIGGAAGMGGQGGGSGQSGTGGTAGSDGTAGAGGIDGSV